MSSVYRIEVRDPLTGELCLVKFTNQYSKPVVAWQTITETADDAMTARRAELEAAGWWIADEQKPVRYVLSTTARDWHVALSRPMPGKPKLGAPSLWLQNKAEHSAKPRETTTREVTFADWPADAVRFVVYKCAFNGCYYCAEKTTMLKAGAPAQRTQSAAVRAQWFAMENMRLAKNHGGSHASVVNFICQCIDRKQ